MHPLHFLLIAVVAAVGLILNWRWEICSHNRRLNAKKLRIHVNGIRGKSTVTRIIAGMLRHAEWNTVAKTTGSAACVIDNHGNDQNIRRIGAPTILEQIDIISRLDQQVDALVIECMAIKPEYQRICEDKLVRSNIGIITNVREDHQEVLGETLEQIAQNLLSTCPRNGVLITAEQNLRLLNLFRYICARRQTRLVVADPTHVSDDELSQFPYVAFKDNVAIGLALAKELKLDRALALAGMSLAKPDPGALTIRRCRYQDVNITWADLFAVNDRESVISCVERVARTAQQGTIKIGFLNNRADRERRATQFARIAAKDLNLDLVVLLGAYEQRVATLLLENGFAENRIIKLGKANSRPASELIEEVLSRTDSREVLMFGMVNIHTSQAESLRNWFLESEGVAE